MPGKLELMITVETEGMGQAGGLQNEVLITGTCNRSLRRCGYFNGRLFLVKINLEIVKRSFIS
jgi:hypothetical protein